MRIDKTAQDFANKYLTEQDIRIVDSYITTKCLQMLGTRNKIAQEFAEKYLTERC